MEGGPLGLVLRGVDGAAVQLVRGVQRGPEVHVVANAEHRHESHAAHVKAHVEPATALATLAALTTNDTSSFWRKGWPVCSGGDAARPGLGLQQTVQRAAYCSCRYSPA